jgi:hypothetical protein
LHEQTTDGGIKVEKLSHDHKDDASSTTSVDDKSKDKITKPMIPKQTPPKGGKRQPTLEWVEPI